MVLGTSVAVSACADVWGFEDGVRGSVDAGQPQADDSSAEASADAAMSSESCSLTCVAPPPPGWRGPYQLSETNGKPPPPPAECSGSAFPVDVYDGFASPGAADASCQCTCGPATGSSCAAPALTLFHGDCSSGSQCMTVASASSACIDFDPECGGAHLSVSAPAAVAGTCAPSATQQVPDVGWAARARLCSVGARPAAGVCADGGVCMPAAGLPFESVYCIAAAAVSPCPPGPYTSRRVYYGGATDTRGCSACSCAPPSVDCQGGTVSTFDEMGCGGPPGHTWSTPQSCTGIGKGGSARYNGDAVPNVGPCAASGGVPTGQVTPATPTTICCTE